MGPTPRPVAKKAVSVEAPVAVAESTEASAPAEAAPAAAPGAAAPELATPAAPAADLPALGRAGFSIVEKLRRPVAASTPKARKPKALSAKQVAQQAAGVKVTDEPKAKKGKAKR